MLLKPKLLIATDSFLPRWDGITRFIMDILPELTNSFEITILCPKFQGDYDFKEKAKIIRIPITSNKQYYPDVNKKQIEGIVEKSDIIFVPSLGPIGSSSIKLGKKYKKAVIANVQVIYWDILSKNRILEPIISRNAFLKASSLYRLCDLLIVPSIHTAKLFEKKGIKTPKVVVKTGIDSEKFVPPENKENAKEFIGIDNTKKVLGFVGRLTKDKDLMTLYDAFKRLEAKHHNIFLLIVGSGNQKLERLFKKEENIRLIKSTNNIIPYLQAMDIFVMPSLAETSSIATIEAMSCGVPVVVTKTGDFVKYIKDKENGVFFSKKNDLLLSLKIDWLLKEDFVRKSLGMNSRETAQNIFRLDEAKKKIRRILEGF